MAASFAACLKKMVRNHQPDLVFAEPSSMVVTRELRDASAMGLRDVSYDLGPFITLVDGPDFDFNWLERRELLLGQISGADIVAFSRADLVNEDEAGRARSVLKDYTEGLVSVSSLKGWGLSELADRILGNESKRAALL